MPFLLFHATQNQSHKMDKSKLESQQKCYAELDIWRVILNNNWYHNHEHELVSI